MRQDIKMLGHDGSGNILSPKLTLQLNGILEKFPPDRRKDELNQVTNIVIRNISNLRQLYNYYCTIGHNRVQSTKSELTRLQFWRFILDSHIHHYGLSLPEMDRILANCLEKGSIHQPLERLSISDFLSSLAILGYLLFKDKIPLQKNSKSGTSSAISSRRNCVLSPCLQKLINEHIMMYSGRVKGGFLFEPRKGVNALKYMEVSWRMFKSLCEPGCSAEPTVMMRKVLFALKDLQIIGPRLSNEKFFEILVSDHPNVNESGNYNLEIEITFLEYFEILVACAMTFVNKDELEKQMQTAGQRPMRFQTGPSSAGSGIGHSRPGSAYSRRSVRSTRSMSAQSSAISSIGEEDSDSGIDKTATTSEVGGRRHTVPTLENLNIRENVEQPAEQAAGAESPPMFQEELEDDESEKIKNDKSSPEVITAEMEEKEKQFMLWSAQLRIFFMRHLYPAWHRVETLRREAARHRSMRSKK